MIYSNDYFHRSCRGRDYLKPEARNNVRVHLTFLNMSSLFDNAYTFTLLHVSLVTGGA